MKVIRLQQVMEMTGLGRSTIYKYVSESWFPKPIPLGGGAWVGWRVRCLNGYLRGWQSGIFRKSLEVKLKLVLQVVDYHHSRAYPTVMIFSTSS